MAGGEKNNLDKLEDQRGRSVHHQNLSGVGSDLILVSFTGGVAGASSAYRGSKYAPGAAFDPKARIGWMSGKGGAGKVPQLIFYSFAAPQIIAKVAFKPRQDCRRSALRLAPTKFEIVASDGEVGGAGGKRSCDAKKSKWITLAAGSGKLKKCRDEFQVKIDADKRAAYRCYGIRAIESPSKKVALARIRMWRAEGKKGEGTRRGGEGREGADF